MGKALDLTNQTFGKLMVLYKTDKRKNGKIVWHCKCECGNECDIPSTNLTSGNTKSCGCYRKKLMSTTKKIDLTNQVFSYLTVLRDSGERQNRNVLWICQCKCGNIIKVQGTALISGHTKSCGCIKSAGEEKINNILNQNKIKYQTQKKFLDCKNIFSMPFDFAIYKNEKLFCLIEYDGDIHFKYRETGWNTKENFEQRKQNDKNKNEYCLNNNIPLYRIPYYDIDKISTYEDLIQEKYLVKEINHYHLDKPTS